MIFIHTIAHHLLVLFHPSISPSHPFILCSRCVPLLMIVIVHTMQLERLKELVALHTSEPNKHARGRGSTNPTVHWNKISEILNRHKIDCVNKWTYLYGSNFYRTMKRGPFTADEDKIIIDAVKDWGSKGIINFDVDFIIRNWLFLPNLLQQKYNLMFHDIHIV